MSYSSGRAVAPIPCLNSPRCDRVFKTRHSLRQHFKVCRYSVLPSSASTSVIQQGNQSLDTTTHRREDSNPPTIVVPCFKVQAASNHLGTNPSDSAPFYPCCNEEEPSRMVALPHQRGITDNEFELADSSSSYSDVEEVNALIDDIGGNKFEEDDSFVSCTSSNPFSLKHFKHLDKTSQLPVENMIDHIEEMPSEQQDVEFQGAAPSSCKISIDNEVFINLLQLCDKLQVPLYGYDLILKWMHESFKKGYSFPTRPPSRIKVMEHLHNMAGIPEYAKPIVRTVHLSAPPQRNRGGRVNNQPNTVPPTVNVVTFPFQAMFESLISDPILMQPDNLLFDPENDIPVLLPSHPHDDDLGDINTGDWFKVAYEELKLSDSRQPSQTEGHVILCPLILFIDKTQVDKMSKWSLEPVLFTLGIFKRSARNLSSFWRPLGFVPDESLLPYSKFGYTVNGVSYFLTTTSLFHR